jgi:hypothetical protein
MGIQQHGCCEGAIRKLMQSWVAIKLGRAGTSQQMVHYSMFGRLATSSSSHDVAHASTYIFISLGDK